MTEDEAIAKAKVSQHRLKSALDSFYGQDISGDPIALEAAALNISIPVRVMIHQTIKSDALLGVIDPAYMDKLIHFRPLIAPPPKTLPSGVQTMTVTIPVNLAVTTTSTRFIRYKGEPTPRVKLTNWWNDPCWDSGNNKISNRDMILAFANKEGGAHVDDDMAAKYKAAKGQGKIVIGGTPVNDVVRLGSLVGIAGDELLEYLRENYPEI